MTAPAGEAVPKMPEDRSIDEIRHLLLKDITRWMPEILAGGRSTLWHGVFTKAHQEVEALVRACTFNLVARAGGADGIIAASAGGKPLSALTMGQHVDLLRRLGGNLVSKEDRSLLDQLTAMRNKFVHGRLPLEAGEVETVQFLLLAQKLCDSSFVAAFIGASRARGSDQSDEMLNDNGG